MIDNLDQFEQQIARDMKLPENLTGEQVQKVAIQALRGLVLGTPIRTGRARGNWNVDVGSADLSTTEQTDPSGAATISSGTATILNANPYAAIWIANGLDYIMPLAQGHSRQAPAGWVEDVIRNIEDQFDDL